MKNVTIELTYDEVSTIRRALGVLTICDKEKVQRGLYSREVRKNIDMEIETCMELLKSDGKVYKAWMEAWKEAWKETL
nr:MAG TPA: hypothetical protein [Caudoviricetes sp.]